MKIEKPIENWTKFPNCILDNLGDFTPSELKVLALMVRKNLGFENPNKKFSLDYISKKIKMGKPTVSNAVKGLINKCCIIKIGVIKNTYCFDINWIDPNVENPHRLKNLTDTGKEIEPEPVKKLNSLKENKVKENKVKENKESQIQIPDILANTPGFLDAWFEWIEYKKQTKKKLTPLTAIKQLNKLINFNNPIGSIHQSIENGWIGLFPVKENYQNKSLDTTASTFNSLNDKYANEGNLNDQ